MNHSILKSMGAALVAWGALFVVSVGLCAGETAFSDYMSVDEFYAAHPEQQKVLEAFNALVAAPGVPDPGFKQAREVRIAVIYPGEQVSDYFRRSVSSFKKRMDEIKLKHHIFEYFTKPVVSTREQQKQINEALSQDPDYLIFTLDAFQHRRMIERILTRARPKIILQNITTPLRAWEGRQPFMYVGFDHIIGTKLLAEYFRNKTPEGAYGMLFFGPGYVSDMRGKTFIQLMNENPKLELRSAYYTDGNREKAKQAALRLLAEADVDFLYACSTDVAMGALDALKETGKLGRVALNGWGGAGRELESIVAGELDVTVMRINDDNGVAMAEAIRLDQMGEGDKAPTVYSGEFVVIEKGISKEKLQKLRQRAFRYSGVE